MAYNNMDAANTSKTCNLSRCKETLGEVCFYCEYPGARHQHDHAPKPKRVGGESVVRSCLSCHASKDRNYFETWPAANSVRAVQELASYGWSPEERASEWPTYWGSLSVDARILWAKACQLAWDRADLYTKA